jgi:shikimate dehydrogenase
VTAGITGATRVYLHLAHPSAHARTPQVMNAEFARRGVDAVAVSADVAPADLGGFARGLRGWRNLAGLSVTMPHKEALAAHVDELIGAAAPIGAVNVVPCWDPRPGAGSRHPLLQRAEDHLELLAGRGEPVRRPRQAA